MFWVSVCFHISLLGLPWWLSSKESPRQAGDVGSIPGSRKIPHAEEQPDPYATTTEPVL